MQQCIPDVFLGRFFRLGSPPFVPSPTTIRFRTPTPGQIGPRHDHAFNLAIRLSLTGCRIISVCSLRRLAFGCRQGAGRLVDGLEFRKFIAGGRAQFFQLAR